MATFRNFTRRLFIILNIVTVFLFLLACANVYLHPGKWWIITLLGLVFPLLLVGVVCFFIIFLFLRPFRRWCLLSLAALLIGWPNIRNFLAMHPGNTFHKEKPPHSLRVLTWNVRSFDEFITKKNGASGHRPAMMKFIDSLQADIVCLQEFFEPHNVKGLFPNIKYIDWRLHFPYHYFSHDYGRLDGQYEGGVIIFSRYPIIDTLMVRYSRPDGIRATESLIAADILVGEDTLRVFTTHLQSVLFRQKDFRDIQIIKNIDDSVLEASRSIVKKLRYAFLRRGEQAGQVRAALDNSPYPGIICGDFNDVPNSYTYYTIRKDWKDAFLEKGFGIGRTYVNISPTLRIDYILTDPRFQVLQCRKFPLPWSDHHPVVADVELQARTTGAALIRHSESK